MLESISKVCNCLRDHVRVVLFLSPTALLHFSHGSTKYGSQIFRRRAVAINSLGALKYLRRYAWICYFTAALEGLAPEPNKIS